ncbi:cilia- and flagella-associated protein 74 isoform X5 [Hippocampus zosterae]|uniref:cilia- and flagella-associated protein 74 isoform X5 n=1 Tax=Hippocampus zosterae TaxID=109293 RepID=UPI00223E26EA|nr:cilia- and flagella-associated protein 74 isoform X5 [Hippocampus zosterae]
MEEVDNGCEWDVASDTCEQTTDQLSSDEDTDGKEEHELKMDDLKDEEAEELPDLEWLEELYNCNFILLTPTTPAPKSESESDDDLACESGDEKERTFSATARMFKLRRNLDQLDNFHRQKECALLKAREDLNLLRQSIESLLEQRDVLEQEIEHQEAAENSVAVTRLRAQHRNLCYELQREEEIETHTNNELRQQELELSEVELEVGKFSVLRQEVQEEERVFKVFKAQNAVKRLQQEKNNSRTLQRKIQHLKKKNVDVLEKTGTLSQKKKEDGQANRKVGAKYLRETVRRMQQQEAEREQRKRESMQKRIEAVKLLKSNIEATQENLRVRQSRAKANALKKERHEKRLKETLQAQGINSTRHIYQQKRDEEMKQKQEEFKERQKARRVEIVDKLLEEQLVKSRKAQEAPLPKTKTGHKILSPGRIREKLLRYLDSVHPSGTERETTQLRNLSASGSSSDSEYQEDIIQKEMQHLSLPDSLEEPEFCGLWDQNFKPPMNEKTTLTPTDVKREHAVVCPKLSTTPKKVGGKQIKGPSFTSKPEVILFKDFEVGETYKKKVILTNISYITNHCKFLGISAQLQDFIMINFQPPGPLSTGMSCEMHITFHPSINEDLEGEVDFASAAGRFSVPVRCTIKRCDLEVDNQFIDFGSHVVGQTISRTITLTNKGALATRFSLDTTKPVPEIHQVQMPSHRSADTQQDTSTLNTDQTQSTASTREVHSMDRILDRSTVSRKSQRACIPRSLRPCLIPVTYVLGITSTALKLTFDLWPEMRKHIEIIPRTGFLQAQSSFTAHLKFVPRNTLPQDANKYFDSATGVLEVPMTVQVAGQVQPVIYTVQAIVTSSDLKFGQSEVDFGYCSIYQSVKSSVRLTNMSLLPQEFGFVGLPEFVDVQPNDGFGTLLPQETLEIDVIFSANKAKEYRFHLSCKSGINRVFPLACRAMGVCPTLALSHSLVQFGPTAVGDHSTALLYLTYNQTVRNQSKQRPSAGARLFSFTPPQDSSIIITPAAGRLLPGKRCLVLVTFNPKLEDRDIKEEALRLLLKAKQTKEDSKKLLEEEAKRDAEPSKGKKLSKASKLSDFSSKTSTPVETPPPDNIEAGGQRFEEARASLLHSFTSRYSEYTIPCFVSDGDPPEEDRQAQPTWSPLNTVYLKLQCPAIQPPLVVVSSNIRNYALDFQQVAVGERVTKRFSVKNISEESLEMRSSLLDIYGPFSLLNSLRGVGPGEQHTLVLAFCPTLEKKYCETLEVRCQKMTLAVTLRGEGVVPAITSSHSGGLLDFGYVLEKESTSYVLKLQNSSAVAVGFKAMLYSLSLSKTKGADERVALLLGGYTNSKIQPVVGTQNYNGLSVFSVLPVEGSIAARQSQDVVVTFHPDHPSANYSDQLTIELVNKSKLCVLDLRGAASSHNMYLLGGEPLTVPIESLLPPLITSQTHLAGQSDEMEIQVLVTLLASYSMGTIRPAVKNLEVGCIRASKKGNDFNWDNMASLQQMGFNVEPSKGNVEAGTRRTIKLTWIPQSGHKPNEVVQTCAPLTLKGDETRVYSVTLIALVSTHVD